MMNQAEKDNATHMAEIELFSWREARRNRSFGFGLTAFLIIEPYNWLERPTTGYQISCNRNDASRLTSVNCGVFVHFAAAARVVVCEESGRGWCHTRTRIDLLGRGIVCVCEKRDIQGSEMIDIAKKRC